MRANGTGSRANIPKSLKRYQAFDKRSIAFHVKFKRPLFKIGSPMQVSLTSMNRDRFRDRIHHSEVPAATLPLQSIRSECHLEEKWLKSPSKLNMPSVHQSSQGHQELASKLPNADRAVLWLETEWLNSSGAAKWLPQFLHAARPPPSQRTCLSNWDELSTNFQEGVKGVFVAVADRFE